MTERDHHWCCECGGGHFLSVSWDASDEHEFGTAEAFGRIAIEGDFWPMLRARVTAAWRVLWHGHATHGVSVALNPATARAIAAVLSDFTDDASAATTDRERDRDAPARLKGIAAQADPAKVARMRAHADEQMARIEADPDFRARRIRLSDLRTAAEIHEQSMRDPEYRREWERRTQAEDGEP